MKTIIVDLDGTICEERSTFERALAQPLPGAASYLEKLWEEGCHIIIYTTRNWSEYPMTKHWLTVHHIPHHQLICGKPLGDVWIDDRAVRFKSWDQIEEDLADILTGEK